MIRFLTVLCALALFPGSVAQAQPTPPEASAHQEFYPLRPGNPGRIDQIIDGKRLRMQDGRIVELAAIDIPDDIAPQAADFLRSFFKDAAYKPVRVYISPKPDQGRVTRMGHDLAHLVRSTDSAWVQGALIEAGLARAWPSDTNPERAQELFEAEQNAIDAARGLWAANSPHAIRSSDTITARDAGTMVVEGTVRSVSMINNVTYLNFGVDWKTDFTVALPRAVRMALTREGIDVLQLQGKFIRVRGWVRSYNGPYMELEHRLLLQDDIKPRASD
jgi:endonuclease YncB( thermonuclease family)